MDRCIVAALEPGALPAPTGLLLVSHLTIHKQTASPPSPVRSFYLSFVVCCLSVEAFLHAYMLGIFLLTPLLLPVFCLSVFFLPHFPFAFTFFFSLSFLFFYKLIYLFYIPDATSPILPSQSLSPTSLPHPSIPLSSISTQERAGLQ